MDPTILVALITVILGPIVAYIVKQRELVQSKKDNAKLSKELASTKEALVLPPMLSKEDYGIKIEVPIDGSDVGETLVARGTFNSLPEGQEIWLSVVRSRPDKMGRPERWYSPQLAASTSYTATRKEWHFASKHDFHIGDVEVVEYVILVAGVNAQALFKYYKYAGSVTQGWPPISKLTTDVVECGGFRVSFSR